MLTKQQIERQDFVDGKIFDLIVDLSVGNVIPDWDIEIIGEIRDIVGRYLGEKYQITEKEFYP